LTVVTYVHVTLNTRFAVHGSFTAGSISDSLRWTSMRDGETSRILTIVGRRDLVAFSAAPSESSTGAGSITGVVVEVDELSDSSTIISFLALSGSMDSPVQIREGWR